MSIQELLNENCVYWMRAEEGPNSDIVISSRIRLARNLRKTPFPHLLDRETGMRIMEEIKSAWEGSSLPILKDQELVNFDRVTALDRQILMEKHLISPHHAQSDVPYRGVLIDGNGSLCTMINEEDHLRIQCFLPGLQVNQAYERARFTDDQLENRLDFAFDSRRGFLTSCPTNVGTGMRASVMLHLPAMTMLGQINAIFNNIGQLGMTVRGLYGEGTEVIGNLFQLSNQITLGQSEEDINNNLSTIAIHIVEQERLMRDKLRAEMHYQLEDSIGRAYGILTNARVMTSNEAIALLSNVRLGVDMGIIRDIKLEALNELVVAIRPAHLQKKVGREMDPFNRDVARAQVIKERFSQFLG
ncbi:MAG TPA: protein arginine kinase [Syntrophomonadaceae bacterium]|nr:protein arginine kinase [Syntrophomonadaceae bacterium]